MVDDLGWAAEHLGLSRFALAGHSTSGMSALAFAAAHPQAVSALALLESDPLIFKEGLELLIPFRGPETLPSFAAFVAAALARRGESAAESTITRRLQPLLRTSHDGSWTWRQDPRLRPRERAAPARPRSEAEVIRMVESVRVPVLVLHGEKSPVLDRDIVGRTLARFTGCAARSEEIPGAGHALLADNAQAVTLALARFFSTAEA
jgi:pimeloyl-ACP methyl ester carboxylesterase